MSLPRAAGDADLATLAAAALAEDHAHDDVTAAATVASDAWASGRIVSRSSGVVAGIGAAAAVFAVCDAAVAFTAQTVDGDLIEPGTVVATVAGPTRALLGAERTALNLLGHCAGVATLTTRYVAAVAGTTTVVRDTRKTLPGLRRLQKDAVVAGGGHSHRRHLGDALLVKDNHAVAAGGVGSATRAALAAAGDLAVQIEVDSLDELDEALAAGARALLCDNFDAATLRTAVQRCRAVPDPVFVEASGGISLDTAATLAATGVDALAVGALTHSAPALDIGLDLVVEP